MGAPRNSSKGFLFLGLVLFMVPNLQSQANPGDSYWNSYESRIHALVHGQAFCGNSLGDIFDSAPRQSANGQLLEDFIYLLKNFPDSDLDKIEDPQDFERAIRKKARDVFPLVFRNAYHRRVIALNLGEHFDFDPIHPTGVLDTLDHIENILSQYPSGHPLREVLQILEQTRNRFANYLRALEATQLQVQKVAESLRAKKEEWINFTNSHGESLLIVDIDGTLLREDAGQWLKPSDFGLGDVVVKAEGAETHRKIISEIHEALRFVTDGGTNKVKVLLVTSRSKEWEELTRKNLENQGAGWIYNSQGVRGASTHVLFTRNKWDLFADIASDNFMVSGEHLGIPQTKFPVLGAVGNSPSDFIPGNSSKNFKMPAFFPYL
jgi:hypothetical protein